MSYFIYILLGIAILLILFFLFRNNKYRLTDETTTAEYNGTQKTLYRIQALKDFGNVKAGDLGGFIESTSNLSKRGSCWVYDDGAVFCDAKVYGDAKICDNADVYDNARVYGKAKVSGNAKIYDNAKVSGRVKVKDYGKVCGDDCLSGSEIITGKTEKYIGKGVETGVVIAAGTLIPFGGGLVAKGAIKCCKKLLGRPQPNVARKNLSKGAFTTAVSLGTAAYNAAEDDSGSIFDTITGIFS